MDIVVNGEAVSLPRGGNLESLMTHLALQNARIAVELNREIVPRSEFATRVLQDGDHVEIVQAIGGG